MKVKVVFPGKIKVCFREGPTGYLRQDPSDEAKRIKDNPNLQDKSAPQSEDKVKENAHSVVFMRGGDVSDRQEVLGEYVLQFGKYKGKSFWWLLENDVGYTIFLTKKVEEEERAGQFKPEGPKKDSLLSFLEYSRSFQEIEDLIKYLAGRSVAPPVRNEDDNLVGFGINADKTCERFPPGDPPEEVREERFAQDDIFGVASLGSQTMIQPAQPTKVKDEMTPPLPFAPSPRAACTGPIKAGGLLFVLDHFRWTQPMRDSIDGLLTKYHGQKDLLTKVDAEYAALVQAASRDPNSLLHPITNQHISRYVKHLAKMTNTSSSLNTSSEKLLETQQLWHHLTEGSETVSVPVVTLPPAPVNPPSNKPQEFPLTKGEIKQMVKEIVEKQQQQQPVKKITRTVLLAASQSHVTLVMAPPFIFFYQSANVKYFYCSTKIYQMYAVEGLTNPRMPFADFAETPFFKRELQAAKQRSAEARQVMEERRKRKAMEQHPTGRLCRFCHKPLKQGPESPHIHTGFPGVAGKYVYCPARVFSLYQTEGMTHEMTWGEFCQSSFYEAERKRWAAEKGK